MKARWAMADIRMTKLMKTGHLMKVQHLAVVSIHLQHLWEGEAFAKHSQLGYIAYMGTLQHGNAFSGYSSIKRQRWLAQPPNH